MTNPNRKTSNEDMLTMSQHESAQVMHGQVKLVTGLCDLLLDGQESSISWARDYTGKEVGISIDRTAVALFAGGQLYVQENVPVATMITAHYPTRDGYADKSAFGIAVLDNGYVYAQQASTEPGHPPLRRLPIGSFTKIEEFLEHTLASVRSKGAEHYVKHDNEELLVYLARAAAETLHTSVGADDVHTILDPDLLRQLKVVGMAADPFAVVTQLFDRAAGEEKEVLAISRFPYAHADAEKIRRDVEVRLNWTSRNFHQTKLIGALTIKANGKVEVLGSRCDGPTDIAGESPTRIRRPAQPLELARFLQLLQDPKLTAK
jgi:hypothetical protein